MNLKNFKKRLFTSILLLFLIFLIFKSNLFFTYTLIILGILSLMEFTNMTKIFIKNKKKLYLANFSFLFYIISVFSIFFISYNYFQTKIIMFSLLFCCVASILEDLFSAIYLKAQNYQISLIKPYQEP